MPPRKLVRGLGDLSSELEDEVKSELLRRVVLGISAAGLPKLHHVRRKKVPHSFTGKEAVTWMVNSGTCLNDTHALSVAEQLVRDGSLVPVQSPTASKFSPRLLYTLEEPGHPLRSPRAHLSVIRKWSPRFGVESSFDQVVSQITSEMPNADFFGRRTLAGQTFHSCFTAQEIEGWLTEKGLCRSRTHARTVRDGLLAGEVIQSVTEVSELQLYRFANASSQTPRSKARSPSRISIPQDHLDSKTAIYARFQGDTARRPRLRPVPIALDPGDTTGLGPTRTSEDSRRGKQPFLASTSSSLTDSAEAKISFISRRQEKRSPAALSPRTLPPRSPQPWRAKPLEIDLNFSVDTCEDDGPASPRTPRTPRSLGGMAESLAHATKPLTSTLVDRWRLLDNTRANRSALSVAGHLSCMKKQGLICDDAPVRLVPQESERVSFCNEVVVYSIDGQNTMASLRGEGAVKYEELDARIAPEVLSQELLV